jgi:hypothetical protein
MHRCIEPLISSNQTCDDIACLDYQKKVKGTRVLNMQVDNLDRKRKEIDQKIDQFEGKMIDHLNSPTERCYRRRLAIAITMHHCKESLLSSNQTCDDIAYLDYQKKIKGTRVLDMQVDNLDKKRKEIDQKIDQFEGKMIDHLNSSTGRYYRRRLASCHN